MVKHTRSPQRSQDVFIELPARLFYLPAIGHFAKAVFSKHPLLAGCRDDWLYSLELLLYEACSNVIKHAYLPGEEGKVRIKLWFENDMVIIEVIDFGPGFELENIPEPNLNPPPEGGMGLYLIKKLSDRFSYFYSHKEEGNVLHAEVIIPREERKK